MFKICYFPTVFTPTSMDACYSMFIHTIFCYVNLCYFQTAFHPLSLDQCYSNWWYLLHIIFPQTKNILVLFTLDGWICSAFQVPHTITNSLRNMQVQDINKLSLNDEEVLCCDVKRKHRFPHFSCVWHLASIAKSSLRERSSIVLVVSWHYSGLLNHGI